MINGKANLLVNTVISQTFTVTKDSTSWLLTADKPGYTPLMWSPLIYGWSPYVIFGIENYELRSGHFGLSGFVRIISDSTSYSPTLKTVVLWIKDTL